MVSASVKNSRTEILFICLKVKNTRQLFFGNNSDICTMLINFMIKNELSLSDEITALKHDENDELKKYFSEIIELYKNQSNANFPIMANFYSLLCRLYNTMPKAAPKDRGILPAIEYIDSHMSESPKVPQLAKLCLISESGLRKRFFAAMKKTPHEYILSIKLDRACRMLANPEIPIYQIADELGFCDAAHFTKIFSSKYKKSPCKYRADCSNQTKTCRRFVSMF